MEIAGDLGERAAAFRGELLTLVRRRLPQESDAEDVVQDVFLRLLDDPERLVRGEGSGAWLNRVVANAVIDFHRRNSSRGRTLERYGLDPATGSESSGGPDEAERFRADLARCMAPMLAALAPEDREALELTDLGLLSQKAAAEHLGISHSAMKSRVQRARSRLHRAFVDCCRFDCDARGRPFAAELRRSDKALDS